VIVRPASSLAQDRESSPVKDQRSTTVLRRQLKGLMVKSYRYMPMPTVRTSSANDRMLLLYNSATATE